VPTWAYALALELHLDASNLHLTVLNLYLNHLSPMNHNSFFKKSQHVHAHRLRQVEE
jgi:hypothetical protein